MSRSMNSLHRINRRMAALVIPLSLLVAWLIYHYILGDASNFEEGIRGGQPVKNNYLGTIYRGGPIVVILISFQVMLVTYVLERFFSLRMAKGQGDVAEMISAASERFQKGDLQALSTLCQDQGGSVAHVIEQGCRSFQEKLDEQTRPLAPSQLQNELENAAQLEVPLLQKNMGILSTLAQIATLVGLLGTVTGMIIAFSALARVGAPDAVGLASGISQALVTTALGISTSAIAIVFYNYFNNRIEQIAYSIDEAIFRIVRAYPYAKPEDIKK